MFFNPMETIEMDANKTRVVIKFGGHALDDPELNSAFCQNLVFLRDQAMEFVIVHGGGPQIGNYWTSLAWKAALKMACGLRMKKP